MFGKTLTLNSSHKNEEKVQNLVFLVWYDMLYLLTAIGFTPGGSSTVHIYTQTIHRATKKYKQNIVNIVFRSILPIFYNSIQHNGHVSPERYSEQQ